MKRERKLGKGYQPDNYPTISIIIYAKNESVNLHRNLPDILTQDYPTYEVVVINDGSTDESEEVLKIYEAQYSNLYHTFIPQNSKYLSRKKLALTVGIKAAKNDLLLFTEANCRPLSPNWIKEMVRGYTSETEIILGFCSFKKPKGFYQSLIGYDNLMNGIKYLSGALSGWPYAGNGRNLSYRKELFFKDKGYSKTLALHAGDDDLFINQHANSYNTKTCYVTDSITEAEIPERFSVWKEMKVSRAATQKYYKGKALLFYRIESLIFFLFLIGALMTFVMGLMRNPLLIGIAILLYSGLQVIKGIILKKNSQILRQTFSFWLLPFMDIALPVFDLYVKFYRIFRGKNDYTFYMNK